LGLISRRVKRSILSIAVCIAMLIIACKEDTKNDLEELTNVPWKLSLLVDENGVARKPEPDWSNAYTITFDPDGTAEGKSVLNTINIFYSVKMKQKLPQQKLEKPLVMLHYSVILC
jgi:hypothetical protein